MAKPLYEATKVSDTELLLWTGEQEKAFHNIKQGLTRAPVLGLPDLKEPFILYVAEKQGTALGVFVQKLEVPQAIFPNKLCGLRLAWLPPGCSCPCFISGRSEQTYLWTATGNPDPSSSIRDSGN